MTHEPELPAEALETIDDQADGGGPSQTDNGLDQPDAPQDAEPVEGSVTAVPDGS